MYKIIIKKCKIIGLLSSILIDSDNLNKTIKNIDRREICLKAFEFLNKITKDDLDLKED